MPNSNIDMSRDSDEFWESDAPIYIRKAVGSPLDVDAFYVGGLFIYHGYLAKKDLSGDEPYVLSKMYALMVITKHLYYSHDARITPEEDELFATNDFLSFSMHTPLETINKCVQSLEKKGYISIRHQDKVRYIKVLCHPDQ